MLNLAAVVYDPNPWMSSKLIVPATREELIEAFAAFGPTVRAILYVYNIFKQFTWLGKGMILYFPSAGVAEDMRPLYFDALPLKALTWFLWHEQVHTAKVP